MKPKPYFSSSRPLSALLVLTSSQTGLHHHRPSPPRIHLLTPSPCYPSRSSQLTTMLPAHTSNPPRITALRFPAVLSLLEAPQAVCQPPLTQTKPLESEDYELNFLHFTVPNIGLRHRGGDGNSKLIKSLWLPALPSFYRDCLWSALQPSFPPCPYYRYLDNHHIISSKKEI